jgi:hypothetical protein
MRARVPYIDRIWRVTSSLDLEEPISADEAFRRLDPLLQSQGSEVRVEGNVLTYAKSNPTAQDKLSTFTSGTLAVEQEGGRSRLFYDVSSTALFLCFLAPLAFLVFGQVIEFINEVERPALLAEKEQREREKGEEDEEPEEVIELHWIDKMLGATAPEQPGDKDEEEARASGDGDSASEDEEEEEFEGNHSPTASYVFAGIFFVVYLVGRVLEPFLLKRTFRAALAPSQRQSPGAPAGPTLTRREGSEPSEMIENSG